LLCLELGRRRAKRRNRADKTALRVVKQRNRPPSCLSRQLLENKPQLGQRLMLIESWIAHLREEGVGREKNPGVD
jgi:hypothetical protein